MSFTDDAARDLLRRLFARAVEAALPAHCVPPALPVAPPGRTLVVGAGKAAAAMAQAVEQNWQGALSGLVVTRYGHGRPTAHIDVVEAAHPVPDAAGQDAARRILALAADAGPDDLVLCLISGGGSALLSLPSAGLSLADKQAVTEPLLKCGATIGEINTVRKHLSAIKGGRLAQAAADTSLHSLMISDVPGDNPAVIASGPTVPDPTNLGDARAVLAKYAITAPAAVARHLLDPAAETPKPGDPCFRSVTNTIVAAPRGALVAAAAVAADAGIEAVILGDDLEGEARALGAQHAALARAEIGKTRPILLLSGGETTVTVTGTGRGGRNAEYLLGFGLALGPAPGVWAIACDSDGIDGSEDNAGALWAPDSLDRAAAAGIDAEARLAANDAYGLFSSIGDLIVTGPTFTNVNDFRAILVSSGEQ